MPASSVCTTAEFGCEQVVLPPQNSQFTHIINETYDNHQLQVPEFQMNFSMTRTSLLDTNINLDCSHKHGH